MGPGVLAAFQILDLILARAATLSALIGKAQAEGRDVTEAELDALAAGVTESQAKLAAAIAAART